MSIVRDALSAAEKNQNSIQCYYCKNWSHQKCAKLTTKEFKQYCYFENDFMCKICDDLTYPFSKLSNDDFEDTVLNGNVNLLNLRNNTLVDLTNLNCYELE